MSSASEPEFASQSSRCKNLRHCTAVLSLDCFRCPAQIYIAELAPNSHRGKLLALMGVANALSIMASHAVDVIADGGEGTATGWWRAEILFNMALPVLLLLLLLHMPESPAFVGTPAPAATTAAGAADSVEAPMTTDEEEALRQRHSVVLRRAVVLCVALDLAREACAGSRMLDQQRCTPRDSFEPISWCSSLVGLSSPSTLRNCTWSAGPPTLLRSSTPSTASAPSRSSRWRAAHRTLIPLYHLRVHHGLQHCYLRRHHKLQLRQTP